MLARPLPPFLDIYSLSMLSLECKFFGIFISFLVLYSIYWSSSLVHFKTSSSILKGDCPGVYPLDEFSATEIGFEFSRSSEILFFNFFFHLCLFDDIRFQYCLVLISFLFFERSDFFLDLSVLFLPSIVLFCYSLLAEHIFLCWISSLYADCCYGTWFSSKIMATDFFFEVVGYHPPFYTQWTNPCTIYSSSY